MAKNNKSEFNNAQFHNAKFFDGNGKSRNFFQQNSSFSNVESASEQTKGQLESVTSSTVQFYDNMYNQLSQRHATYLTGIGKAEKTHYTNLIKGTGGILEQYNGMYAALEARHKQYLKNIGADKPGVANVPDVPNTSTAMGVATEVTILSIKATLDKIAEDLKYSNGTGGISNEPDTRVALRGIRDNTENMTTEQKRQSREYQTLANNILSNFRSLSSNMVAGKTNTQLLNGITTTLSSFIQGGPYAAAATAILEVANAITGFFGQAISEHYQTMETSFANYGVYVERWNDQYAGYTKDILAKQDELYALDLQDSVKSSDWMKKQVELASKGFSADRSEDAALQDIILSKIVPNLDTSSNIFMDLQQRSMVDIVESLGGLTESVRNISGSSRIAQGSLSTLIDKLGPVELYAKKNLLNNKAAAAVAALESMDISTEDAINIVSTVSGVVSNQGTKLQNGTTLEKLLALKLINGEYDLENALPGLISEYLNYASVFTGGIPKGQSYTPMLTDVLYSTIGASLGAYSDAEVLSDQFDNFYKLYENTTEDPQSAYEGLFSEFKNGFFTTAEEKLENIANNSDFAAGANGFLHQIAEWTMGIYEDIERLVDRFTGRSEADTDARKYLKSLQADTSMTDLERTQKLQEYLSTHRGYSDETAQKLINAMYSSDTARAYTTDELQILYAHDKEGYQNALLNQAAYETSKWQERMDISGDLSDYLDKYAGQSENPYDIQAIKNVDERVTVSDTADEWALLYGGLTGYGLQKLYSKMINKTPSSNYANGGGMATGGYVDRPTVALIGEGQYPEIVSPVPQLVTAVAKGIEYSSKMNPDYSELQTTINNAAALIVEAIQQQGGSKTVILDRATGLAGKSVASLEPMLGGN